MSTTFTEKTHAGEFIISEANGNRSRDVGTLILGQTLQAGAVLGQITASKKWTAWAPAAGTGAQTAKGILLAAADASAADVLVTVITSDAEVNGHSLQFTAASPPLDQTVAAASLALVGIKVRL